MTIDFVPDEPNRGPVPYDDAIVERGRYLVLVMKDSQFELGQIADRLEPKYGEQTIERYAEDIGIDYGTLKSYRTTYKAWKDISVRPKSFSVAKALNPHPRRSEIIQEKPEITLKEAEREVQQWKEERNKDGQSRKRRLKDEIGHIIVALDNFLSEESMLTAMILELCDDPDTDSNHKKGIVKALRNTSLRINTLIDAVTAQRDDEIDLDADVSDGEHPQTDIRPEL